MRTCDSTNVLVLSAGERFEVNGSSARHKQNTWQNNIAELPGSGLFSLSGPIHSCWMDVEWSLQCLWRCRRRNGSSCSTGPQLVLNGSSCRCTIAAAAAHDAAVAGSSSSTGPQRLELLDHSNSRSSKCQCQCSKPLIHCMLDSMLSLKILLSRDPRNCCISVHLSDS